MDVGRSVIPDRVRWAICTGLWLFLGYVVIRLVINQQPMPASSELREVSGTVVSVEEHSRSGRGGTSCWLYVGLQGHAAPYLLNDSHAGSDSEYFRIRNSLRRGDRLGDPCWLMTTVRTARLTDSGSGRSAAAAKNRSIF